MNRRIQYLKTDLIMFVFYDSLVEKRLPNHGCFWQFFLLLYTAYMFKHKYFHLKCQETKGAYSKNVYVSLVKKREKGML